jgi:chromosome segregation ATPase
MTGLTFLSFAMSNNGSSTREMERELARIREELRDVKQTCANLLEVNRRLDKRNDELEAIKHSWMEREEALIQENRELKYLNQQQYDDINMLTGVQKGLQEAYGDLWEEKNVLKENFALMEREMGEAHQSEIENIRKECEEILQKKEKQKEELEIHIIKLEKKNADLKENNEWQKSELETFIGKLEKRSKGCKGNLQEKEKQIEELEKRIRNYHECIRRMRREKQESDRERRKLKAQVCETSELISKQLLLLRESNESRFLRVQAIHCQELEALRESFREEMNLREEGDEHLSDES